MVRTPRRQTFPPTRPTGSYPRREAAIESALKNKLEAKKKAREAAAAAAQREIAEFTAHFMEAAQRCFELIDKDDSGTLTKEEIVVAVKSDKEVIDFLKTCGEPNLVALTQPARLSKALDMLDTSKDGEMDMDEWMAAIKRGLAKRLDELADERERRERAAAAADEEFSAEFLNMARKVRFLRPINQTPFRARAFVCFLVFRLNVTNLT